MNKSLHFLFLHFFFNFLNGPKQVHQILLGSPLEYRQLHFHIPNIQTIQIVLIIIKKVNM